MNRHAPRASPSARSTWRILVVLGALSVCAAGQQRPAPPATTRASDWPIAYRHEVRAEPRLHLHIVTIDLTDPRVELLALPAGADPDGPGPWQMTLNLTSATAARHGLDVAVNANFFMTRGAIPLGGRRVPYFVGNWARAVGWLVSDGRVISHGPAAASLVVDRQDRVRIGKFARLPADARQVVSGSQQILTAGRITARDVLVANARDAPADGQAVAAPATPVPARAPRTAAGITADGNTLVLLVVDGRLLSHSAGMSETELAREMLRLGCVDALNLDGGGSSTLVLRQPGDDADGVKVINRPSDGHDLAFPLSVERAVACIFGARVRQEKPATAPLQ